MQTSPFGDVMLVHEMNDFEELVVMYRKRLFLYAYQMLRNREDAEEVVQDTFFRAYRAWKKMDPKPCLDGRLRAWLFKITLNLTRNRFRKKPIAQLPIHEFHDRLWHGALEDRSSPEVLVEQRETSRLVEHAIGRLPAHLHDAARLRFIDELSHPEIAEQCAQALGTVKSRVFRAKLILRAQLEPDLKKSA